MIKKVFIFILVFSGAVHAQMTQKDLPALIPLPQSVEWKTGSFNIKDCRAIVSENISFIKEVALLSDYLKTLGLQVPVKSSRAGLRGLYIELNLDTTLAGKFFSNEVYNLNISARKISITAANSTGLFYGLQTLKQMIDHGSKVKACNLTDWPAFSWRGYMIDVGRNYMPMHLLKQQIAVMASYKMNIFHFHFTEDIAWRLQSKLYPQLTEGETMLRNKGEFYTEQDLKELIRYCKERHITLVPEIDMPGHSAAFKRAMKTDMQSDAGLVIVKNLIREFCSTYDVPYLHIGADEVKITNKNFLPEVTALIEQLGKKVIGWEPGGNFTESTIRQLWMEGATKVSINPKIKYIDSRHLYLNHMDPLESVATIFNRKISNLDKGNDAALGGIICMWPDRRVNHPEDVFTQNPVYPAMLAFAERTWRGGGTAGWRANIGAPGTKEAIAFAEFEGRLMFNKHRYFSNLPFPYARQVNNSWKFYGPFENEGNLLKKFAPEQSGFEAEKVKPSLTAMGGTIILRHWWAPQVKGLLENPKTNTTWYATTRIWSDEDKLQDFWIGFNNLSRSYASNSPIKDTWDNRGSEVFVNGQRIAPPLWQQAGMSGDLEKPLVDEGYEYRAPTKIRLKKGWNKVLIKLPVASFKGIDWKNPEKWMFTFIKI